MIPMQTDSGTEDEFQEYQARIIRNWNQNVIPMQTGSETEDEVQEYLKHIYNEATREVYKLDDLIEDKKTISYLRGLSYKGISPNFDVVKFMDRGEGIVELRMTASTDKGSVSWWQIIWVSKHDKTYPEVCVCPEVGVYYRINHFLSYPAS